MAPPYASLELPEGYECRPVQRKTPSRDNGQGPQLQVVLLEGSSPSQTSSGCTTYIGDTALTAPFIFEYVVSRDLTT